MNRIQEAISRMSVEEMKERLAAYMATDKEWMPKPVAIQVRRNEASRGVGANIYDVVAIMDDGSEKVVQFRDRCSKLIYIYTLMHPQGYQRRELDDPDHDYAALAGLYRALYLINTDKLTTTINRFGFDHFMHQAIAQSRRFIRKSLDFEDFEIANPRRYNGRILIPAVAAGLKVIVEPSLLNS